MLSFIITTCQRPDMLLHGCQSLQQQEGMAPVEVIVVNNAASRLPSSITAAFPNYRFIHEPQGGLSQARNTGAAAAKGDYLIFLDDDVQFPPGFILIAQEVADSKEFAVFGGSYRPWHPFGKPDWLSDDFGAKQDLRPDRGPIIPGRDGFLSGGVFACRKDVFQKMGGFSTALGMSDKPAYGEEDDLQMRLHAAGYTIGFIPDWWLEHAVLPHKWSLRWQLQSARARRRDRAQQEGATFWTLLSGSLRTLLATLVKAPLLLLKWIFVSDYYWQNVVLDLGIPLARRWGDWERWCQKS